MIKHLTLILLLFSSFVAQAQMKEEYIVMVDSLPEQPESKTWMQEKFGVKGKLLLDFDNHASWVFEERADMLGIRLGMELNEKHRFGVGWYTLWNPVKLASPTGVEDSVRRTANLRYMAGFYEHVIYRDYKWELSVPISFGYGRASMQRTNLKTDTVQFAAFPDVPISNFSLEAHYKFLRFLGIGAGAGYRLMLTDKDYIKDAFSSPVYILKIDVYLGELYKMVFKHGHHDDNRHGHFKERQINTE